MNLFKWFDVFKENTRLQKENTRLQKQIRELENTPKVNLGLSELEDIVHILFPPVEIHQKEDKEFYVDYSVDVNLAVVLRDIQMGKLDLVTVGSLQEAINRIDRVKHIFDVKKGFQNRDVKYYVVGNSFNPEYLDDIEVRADPL